MKNYNIYVHKYGVEDIEFVAIGNHNTLFIAWMLTDSGRLIDLEPLAEPEYRDEYELL